MALLKISIALTILESLAQASLIQLPRATQITRDLDPSGWTPRPTTSPILRPELLRRATLTNAAQYVLVAPDQTCGYVSGSAGADFACGSSTDTCVFFPATGVSAYGAVGCCTSIADCFIRTTCVDRKAYSLSSVCNDACRFDPATLKCTDTSSPYCGSIRYPQATAQDYYCDDVSGSTFLLASTTYSGQTGRSLVSSNFKVISTTSSSSSSSSSGASSTTSTTSASAATSTAAATTASTVKAPVPVGPIVGGVLAGLVLIGLFALGALFILKKYGKKSHSTAASEIRLNEHAPPVEIGGAWTEPSYTEYYKPQSQAFSSQPVYQPIIAEMAVPDGHGHAEKQQQQHGSVQFQNTAVVQEDRRASGIQSNVDPNNNHHV